MRQRVLETRKRWLVTPADYGCAIVIAILALGLTVGLPLGLYHAGIFESGLSENERSEWYSSGAEAGYSWGYWLTFEDPNGLILWTPPDKVNAVQKYYPGANIRDAYIPKGYLTESDVADAHFTDGTPYNSKQRRQATEAYNLGFYDGFCLGSDDCLSGKPNRYSPLP
jgi:hypothetical protein